MRQKDIVWVGAPFSNFEEEKTRPALIVSNNEYNSKNLDVVICAITSNLDKRPYSILISQKDLSEGTLPLPSKIKADKIMQIEKSKILNSFASLKPETFHLVVQEILSLIKEAD